MPVGAGGDGDRAARDARVGQQAHPRPRLVHGAAGYVAHSDPDGVAHALDEDDRGPGAEEGHRVLGKLLGRGLGVGRRGEGQLGPAEALDLVDLEDGRRPSLLRKRRHSGTGGQGEEQPGDRGPGRERNSREAERGTAHDD